jgi:hypothetical protein
LKELKILKVFSVAKVIDSSENFRRVKKLLGL